MNADIGRLNKVATRFSQIGSIPELKIQGLNPIVEDVAAYFKTRLPQLGKKISVKLNLSTIPQVRINRELISWVVENLVRNAIDSIEVQEGLIILSTLDKPLSGFVQLSVSDNGKGIAREHWKRVFQTGFTTKKRGWGIGLALCKRIVEDYHKGKIFIEWSQKGVGSEMRILIPRD